MIFSSVLCIYILTFCLQAAAFRNRILRSIDYGEALEELTSLDISSVGQDYIPDVYAYIHSFTTKVFFWSGFLLSFYLLT